MNHIVLICDDAYVLPTVVTIQSIKECVDREDYCELCVHVCTWGLSESNEEKLKSIANDHFNVIIHVVDCSSMNDKTAKVRQKTHVSTSALIKFELPNIFKDIDKILYLDSDIIVKNDFIKIFSFELSECYLAASYEFWKYLNDLMYTPSNIKKKDFFFNSGVMLLNLKKMRDDSISEKLWDYKLKHAKTKLMDQECFNVVCHKSIKQLSIEWNLNPFFLENKYIDSINNIYGTNFKNSCDMFESAKVIHYVGKSDKPWIYKNARQGALWMAFYNLQYPKNSLCLKDFERAQISFFKRLANKISEHGLKGLFYFMWYKIFSRIKSV